MQYGPKAGYTASVCYSMRSPQGCDRPGIHVVEWEQNRFIGIQYVLLSFVAHLIASILYWTMVSILFWIQKTHHCLAVWRIRLFTLLHLVEYLSLRIIIYFSTFYGSFLRLCQSEG